MPVERRMKKKNKVLKKSLENRLLRNLNKQGIVGNIKINCEKACKALLHMREKKGMQKWTFFENI